MLVYLTSTNKQLSNYDNYHNIPSFARAVLDNEAQEIVCENFLSSFHYNDIPKLLDLIFQKLRLRGTLVIHELDFHAISRQFFREEISSELVNNIVFADNRAIKCFLTLEDLEKFIPIDKFHIESKEFGPHNFVLKIKRIA